MLFTEARDEFLLYLQVERNFSPNTLTSYELDLLMFEDFLIRHNRSQQIEDFNPATVRRFIQELVLKKKLGSRTVARKISCLKSFSRYCLKERFLEKDFMAGIENPKFDKRLPIYMNLDELWMLLNYLESDSGPLALRNELMFKFLATTGLRRQELVDLCWKHIDFSSMTVKVMGKGKKERLLPLHPMIHQLLKHYKESQLSYRTHPEEPIFLNHHGRKLNPRGLHKIFKEVLAKASLPPHRFSLHHLRHTFATLLLQGNKDQADKVDIRLIQELLGHDSLASTAIYTHVDYEQKKKAIENFLKEPE